jgi:antirestriction protein ArdC
MEKPMQAREDIRDEIAQSVIDAMLNDNVIPWRQTWSATSLALPRNALTGKSYRGVNVLALWLRAQARGYTSSDWLTFKQAGAIGGNVKKGERGTRICFWKKLGEGENDNVESSDEQTTKRSHMMLKTFVVFNRAQLEGLPETTEDVMPIHTPIERAQRIIDEMPNRPHLDIRKSNAAFYAPASDSIVLPLPGQFDKIEDYYSTAFHELAHATGHKSRLNRETIAQLHTDNHAYTKEELVAEMTAAFLCAEVGILPATLDNSVAYIIGWVKKIRLEKRLITEAAAAAQRACDYILNRQHAAVAADDTDTSAIAA